MVRGLDECIRYYAEDAEEFKLEQNPAIHLDARVSSDPDGTHLRRHTGRHYEIIEIMVAYQAFGSCMQNAHRTFTHIFTGWSGITLLQAVVFCRSGRHRGVAAAVILEHVLSRVERWKFLPTTHMSIDVDREGCRCKSCRPDREICESIRSSIPRAVAALDLRD